MSKFIAFLAEGVLFQKSLARAEACLLSRPFDPLHSQKTGGLLRHSLANTCTANFLAEDGRLVLTGVSKQQPRLRFCSISTSIHKS